MQENGLMCHGEGEKLKGGVDSRLKPKARCGGEWRLAIARFVRSALRNLRSLIFVDRIEALHHALRFSYAVAMRINF